MSIEIDITRKKNYSLAHVSGRIDTTTSDDLEKSLMTLISNGENNIVLDLENISYISSAGLRVLVVITKKLYESGHFFCSLSTNVREIVEMAGFDTFMNIYKNVEAAEIAMDDDQGNK